LGADSTSNPFFARPGPKEGRSIFCFSISKIFAFMDATQ
jgi:hypothetical protein